MPPKKQKGQQNPTAKEQLVCDLCVGPFRENEEVLECEGECRKHMHRYCAGLTRTHYQELSINSTPFVCLVCTQRVHMATVHNLQSEVSGLKVDVAELKALLAMKATKADLPCNTAHAGCEGAILNLRSDIQQLQLTVKGRPSTTTYAEAVKRDRNSKRKHRARYQMSEAENQAMAAGSSEFVRGVVGPTLHCRVQSKRYNKSVVNILPNVQDILSLLSYRSNMTLKEHVRSVRYPFLQVSQSTRIP